MRKQILLMAIAVGFAYPANIGAQVKFDVASVKMAADQEAIWVRPNKTTGRFRWTSDLLHLLTYAYNVENWGISGVTSNPIYDIEATTDPNTTDDQLRLMLQSLLVERLKMVVHRVTKEVSGYALTVAKNGPKIQEARDGQIPPLPEWLRGPSDRLEGAVVALGQVKGVVAIAGRRVTMAQFIENLQRHLQTAVVDPRHRLPYFAARVRGRDRGRDARSRQCVDPGIPEDGQSAARRASTVAQADSPPIA